MEQITVSVSLEFASSLTHQQKEQLKMQIRSLVDNETPEGGALCVEENEVVDFSIAYDDDE